MAISGDAIQFHIWPWAAIGCLHETKRLDGTEVLLPYHGSPIISVPQGFTIGSDIHHETFKPLGCSYDNGHYQLYCVPHAIAASRRATGDSIGAMKLVLQQPGGRERILVKSDGAVRGSLRDQGQTQQAVLEWMSFFDFCIQYADVKEKALSSVPWSQMLKYIDEYASEKKVQKRSLIVAIAEEMPQHVQNLVHSARRILIHERQLLPATRAAEMDSGCLQWYFRQPGTTPLQKAYANRQRLQGISRRETFNTLENRVLKEFINCCLRESRQYVSVVCSGQTDSGYAQVVNRFGGICSELIKRPVWNDVGVLESDVRPNYVLQSDIRYRKIWDMYQKLLHRQEEEDWMWAWQGRTWANICTLLLGAALMSMMKNKAGYLSVCCLAQARCGLRSEQLQGSRLADDSEPGPFLVKFGNKQAVLEIVNSNNAQYHDIASMLGSTGASLFFVLKPLGRGKNIARVIVIWPVHTLSSTLTHDFNDVQESAEHGLMRQIQFINMRYPVAKLTGLVLADAFLEGEPYFNAGNNTHLARLAAAPELWPQNIEILKLLLEDLFEELLDK